MGKQGIISTTTKRTITRTMRNEGKDKKTSVTVAAYTRMINGKPVAVSGYTYSR